jgi:hypothetical protein
MFQIAQSEYNYSCLGMRPFQKQYGLRDPRFCLRQSGTLIIKVLGFSLRTKTEHKRRKYHAAAGTFWQPHRQPRNS